MIGLTTSAVGREAVRALAAFGVYLVLYPVWNVLGVHDLYRAIVLKIASAIVLATQHFPVVSTLENLTVNHLDNLLILVLGYFLVSTGMRWRARINRYCGLLLAVVMLHVMGVCLETQNDAAQVLLDSNGLVLLLPWEFRVADGFKYLLVDFGLNIGPFVVMLLGAAWNSGLGIIGVPAAGRTRRIMVRTGAAAILTLALAALAWKSLRESDPRHVQTHASLGHLFVRSQQPAKAEGQYRIALAHGTTDGEVYFNLAVIEADRGRKGDALRIQEAGLKVVQDSAWRKRLQEEWTRQNSSR